MSYRHLPLFVEILDGRSFILSTGKGLAVHYLEDVPIQLITTKIREFACDDAQITVLESRVR
jgi:hypothetical protein